MAETAQQARAEFQAARDAGLRRRHAARLARSWERYDDWARRAEEQRMKRTT